MKAPTASVVAIAAARYDAVVFDMDGVITDTAALHNRAWKRTFDGYLAERAVRSGAAQQPFGADDYLTFVDGRQRADGVEGFLLSRGIVLPRGTSTDVPEEETVWGLANRKDREFRRALLDEGAKAFPSSIALVDALQRAGIGTAVVSASRNCRLILDTAGIGTLFPVRVDGLEAERLGLAGKPAPDMFLEATRRLRTDPSRAVVVEDALSGVRAGHDGHFALVIGVDRSGREATALRANGADVVVHDLDEVQVEGASA